MIRKKIANKNKIHKKKNAGKKTFLFRDMKIEIIGDITYNKNKIHENKAGYTATEVACGWLGAIF